MASSIHSSGGEENYDTVLRQIVKYVHSYTPERSQAWERARMALLDALGCAIETLHASPECCRILGPTIPLTTVPNGFRLPGTSYQLDPLKGAFDMGALIRYLDHNDAVGGAEWGHPSDNLGALLAVAGWLSQEDVSAREVTSRPPMNVRTLLCALIKAYEIQGCIQQLNAFNAVGLDHTILVKVASTATICWLLGLSENQSLAALSQAFQDGHPLRTFRQSPNAGPRKGWAGGDACMRAVHLALLSRAGQPGAPTVLTDPRWGFNKTLFRSSEIKLRSEYGSYIIENVAFKLIPAEGHGISAVEAAVELSKTFWMRGLRPEQAIRSMRVRTQKPAVLIIDKTGPLRNPADRDHCLQYIIAVVLLKGEIITVHDYADDSPWASDPRVDALRSKMTVVEDKQFTEDYHDENKKSCSNGLAVELSDGEILPEVVVEHPIGSAKRSETAAGVMSKFRSNMKLSFDEPDISKFEAAVKDDALPVHDLLDLLWKGS